jgi:hypothetical protein
MAHGGKRKGSGRKVNPVKALNLGAAAAARVDKELKTEKQLKEVFLTCGDARLKAFIIFKIWEFEYGKPAQPIRHSGPNEGEAMRMIMEDIGS